jgi:hypothetical protein
VSKDLIEAESDPLPHTPVVWPLIVSFGRFWLKFVRLPECWLVLGRNLIPVFGVYFANWAVDLALFNIWFDGFVGIMAICTAGSVVGAISLHSENGNWPRSVGSAMFQFTLVMCALAVPYFGAVVMRHAAFSVPAMLKEVVASPELEIAFGVVVTTRLWHAFKGVQAKPSPSVDGNAPKRKEMVASGSVILDGFLLFARGFVLWAFVAADFGRLGILFVALALTYFESLAPVIRATPDVSEKGQPAAS